MAHSTDCCHVIVDVLDWSIKICLQCDCLTIQESNSDRRYFPVSVRLQNEIFTSLAFLRKLRSLSVWAPAQWSSLSWKCYIRRWWRRCIFFLSFVWKTHWQSTFGIFLSQLFWNQSNLRWRCTPCSILPWMPCFLVYCSPWTLHHQRRNRFDKEWFYRRCHPWFFITFRIPLGF